MNNTVESFHKMMFSKSVIFAFIPYSSPPLSAVPLFMVLVTHGKPWSEKIKCKMPEINNSQV